MTMRTLLLLCLVAAAAPAQKRNPFYFEGRMDWALLKIDTPTNAWEFAQRGIYKQDDLEDIAGAIADYQESIARNSLANGTCQVITSAPEGFGQKVDPPPCMFTVRLRLANLLKQDDPDTAIRLLNEVLAIDPLRLGVNALLGETYALMGGHEMQAVAAYQAELALSPVTEMHRAAGDEANLAHVHWALADLFKTLDRPFDQMKELDLYLKAVKWHGDTYPWRIALARSRMLQLERSVLPAR